LPVALLNKDFFSPTIFSFALYRFTLLCSGKGNNVTMMTERVILTFSHPLSFAFLHSTGSPGIVLGKSDNVDDKESKSEQGNGNGLF
jgi:hypothetical protein